MKTVEMMIEARIMKTFEIRLVDSSGRSFDMMTFALSKNHAECRAKLLLPNAQILWIAEYANVDNHMEGTTIIETATKQAA